MAHDTTLKVSEEEFPAAGEPEQKLRFLLNYAVLAPSGHNTQPWLFKLSDDRVELYADRIRGLPVVDPEDRALIISCGASLFHLRVALKRFGYSGEVETFPDPDSPDLLARVRLGSKHEATEEERSLFRAIPKRHSNRQAFEDRRVPEPLLSALREAAREEGAWLYVAQKADVKQPIAELIGEATASSGPTSGSDGSLPPGCTPTGAAAATACRATPLASTMLWPL